MLRPSSRPLRAALALTLTAAIALSATGCALVFGEPAEFSSLDEASPDSPRFFEGHNTAMLAHDDIVPIAVNPEPALPVTFTGLDGVTVEITDTSRILALDGNGSLASIVFGLGFGDSVVGRDLATGFESAKHLPLVMDGHSLNAESILDLSPTLILTDYSVGPYDVQLQMRNAGIPIVFFDPAENLDDIPRLIDDVATVLGVPQLGDDYVADFDRRLAEALTRIQTVIPERVEDRVRIVFLYMRGRAGIYHMFGNNPDGSKGSAGVLIDALGGVDVAGDLGWVSGSLTAEGLMTLEPDLYLMLTLGLESVGGVEGLVEIPGIAQTPAGERGRVVDMSDYVLFTWGPRTPEVPIALAEAIYHVDLSEVQP